MSDRPSGTSSDAARRRVTVDPDQAVSTEVILEVAAFQDVEMEDLPPLMDIVDVDALDSLFVDPDVNALLQFEYGGCLVSVRRGTEVLLTSLDPVR